MKNYQDNLGGGGYGFLVSLMIIITFMATMACVPMLSMVLCWSAITVTTVATKANSVPTLYHAILDFDSNFWPI